MEAKNHQSLLFITHEYPNDTGDTAFIRNEIFHVARKFDHVRVLCLRPKSDVIVPFPSANISAVFYSKKYSKQKKIVYLFRLLTSSCFRDEIMELARKKNISIKTITTAAFFFLEALLISKQIQKILITDKTIGLIYTYWYTTETLAALFLKTKYNVKFVTRTHRYDLYKFANRQNYQPYKKFMDNTLDKIFFISKHGYDYYLETFAGSDLKKYSIARLGTLKSGKNPAKTKNDFSLISCSYLNTVKRVHLIVKALAEIDDFNIRWVHIGNGPEENLVFATANKLLASKKNIIFKFLRFMTNAQIMNYYDENYFDCFISTSESEGIPVSMMEAISCGIPIIATNTGGVSELVQNDFGALLDPDCSISDIKKAIVDFYDLSGEKKFSMRKNARLFWENNFNAEINFIRFAEELDNL